MSAKLLIDTGASHSVIDNRFVVGLGLQATGSIDMLTPSTEEIPFEAPTYDVAMSFIGALSSMRHTIPVQSVTVCAMRHQGIDGLIGRDILGSSRLTYGGIDNFFYLSF